MTDRKTISRRTLVKTGIGALAAPAVLRVLPAEAQIRDHQDRPCQPENRSARRLRRSRRLHPRTSARHLEQGPAKRRQDLQGRDHLQGQPVERQPRRGSRVRTDPRRQGQPDRRLGHARHHQSGGRPGRGQRGALHHHQLPVAAVFLRPQGRPEEGLHLDLSFLLGPRGRDRRVPGAVGRRCRPTRWSAGCSPTTPTAMPGAIPSSACRRRLAEGRLQAARSRPLSAHEQRLHLADFRVQGGGCRDRHRQHDPARLRDLLVAGGAAGLQAEDRHHRQGAAVPLRDRLAGRARQRAHQRNLVDAAIIRSSPASPARAASSSPTPIPRRPTGRGRSRSASSTRCSKWRSTCSSAPRTCTIRSRFSSRSSPPTTSRSSGRCTGPASR